MTTQVQCPDRIMHPVFEGLTDISETRPFEAHEDGRCFADLSDYFIQQQMCERFEVTLLHTHFSLFEDEVFVNRFYRDRRILVGKIEAVEKTQAILPWSLRLFRQGNRPLFIPNQYLAVSEDDEYRDFSLTDRDRAFLQGVSAILGAHDALNHFGVQLRLPFLDTNEGEYLMEYIEKESRRAKLAFIGEQELGVSPVIETSWLFSSDLTDTHQICWFHARCKRICHHGGGDGLE